MIAKNRISRNTATIDLAAVKYIRIVIASYVMAVGFELINGFDANIYFSGFLSHPTSVYVSKVFVVFSALMLFFGYFLRLVSLCLAIVILTSSLQANVLFPVSGSIEAFWTDLVLICGLLACYCTLSERQLRKQAFVSGAPMGMLSPNRDKVRVIPRRVTGGNTNRVGQTGLALSMFKARQRIKTGVTATTPDTPKTDRFAHLRPKQNDSNEEMINIFV